MKFTGNFEKMGKIMYRSIFVHHINFYRLENNMKLVSWNVNGIRACAYKLNKQKQKVFGVYTKKAKITIKK